MSDGDGEYGDTQENTNRRKETEITENNTR